MVNTTFVGNLFTAVGTVNLDDMVIYGKGSTDYFLHKVFLPDF